MTRFSDEKLAEILNRPGYRVRQDDMRATPPPELPPAPPPSLTKRSVTPPPERPGMSLRRHDQLEQAEQEALMQWAQLRTFRHECEDGSTAVLTLSDVMFAIPNGSYLQGDQKRRAIQANMLKRTGMKPGVPDLFLRYPRTAADGTLVAAGLFIELKRRRDQFRSESEINRALSTAQARDLELCRMTGYATALAYGWEEAARHICQYMGWEDPRT